MTMMIPAVMTMLRFLQCLLETRMMVSSRRRRRKKNCKIKRRRYIYIHYINNVLILCLSLSVFLSLSLNSGLNNALLLQIHVHTLGVNIPVLIFKLFFSVGDETFVLFHLLHSLVQLDGIFNRGDGIKISAVGDAYISFR